MLVLAGIEPDDEQARARAEAALTSGRAMQTFARLVERQGGNPRIVDDYALLPAVAGRAYCEAPRGGFLTALRAEAIGRASGALGGGRMTAADRVDHAVGALALAKPGMEVRAGDRLVELHHRDGRGLEEAMAWCSRAVTIGDAPPPRDIVLDQVR
jgi:thymidine phosphorylase